MQNLTHLKSETTFNHIMPGGNSQDNSVEGRGGTGELGFDLVGSQQKTIGMPGGQRRASRFQQI